MTGIYGYGKNEIKFPKGGGKAIQPPTIWFLTPDQLERVRKGERTTDVVGNDKKSH
ncbi:hypothetical protein [Heyndrickxia ginsengihumi]|uniref:hypothetical protein n=1 Tax=Heyndrickxia ginsengihumi TaxID=363870 RepID=UPI000AE62EC5|nr:hypothetical protein [Heyndrickxia ginsengihumi]